jgi:hypothetical protein
MECAHLFKTHESCKIIVDFAQPINLKKIGIISTSRIIEFYGPNEEYICSVRQTSQNNGFYHVEFSSKDFLRCKIVSMKLLSLLNKDEIKICSIDIEGNPIESDHTTTATQDYSQNIKPFINLLGISSLSNELLTSLQTGIENLNQARTSPLLMESSIPLEKSNPLQPEAETLPLTRNEVNQMIQSALNEFEKKIDLKLQQTQQSIQTYLQELLAHKV